MKHLSLYLLFLLISTSINSSEIYFKYLGRNEGLPQINIISIYQDETGAMWFGTIEGLCRYNGNNIQTFTSSTDNKNITQNIIYSICGNKKGSIYIKANYDLIKYDLEKEKFETIKLEGVKAIFYKDDILWYATDRAIFKYSEKTKSISEYVTFNDKPEIATSLHLDEHNILWVGTQNGLLLTDSTHIPDSNSKILINNHISTIFIDSKKNIWIGTNDNGVFILNQNGEKVAYYKHKKGENSLSNDQIRTITEDNLGKIWIGTFFGLNCFDPTTGTWTNYTHSDYRQHSISHSSIFSVYKDQQGTMWIGTYFGGMNYFNPELDIFRFYSSGTNDNNNSLSFPFVGHMVEDKENNLWICTEGGGLNCFNLKTRKFSHYLFNGKNFESVAKYNLKDIWYDSKKNKLYIAIHNGGICIFDIQTKTYKILTHDTEDPYSIPSNMVRNLQYYKGELILLTVKGLYKMNLETNRFSPLITNTTLKNILNNRSPYTFYIDSKDNLWLSSHGLIRVNLNNYETKKYIYDKDKPHSIGKFSVNCMLETKHGQMWFSTSGSGLYKYNPSSDNFDNYNAESNALISDFCYYITETKSGNLILLNNNGLSIFDANTTHKTIFRSSLSFPINSFFEGSSCYITSDEEIFIGGTNGLVSTYENQLINISPKAYQLYFDKLHINNKLIKPEDESRILTKALSLCDRIELKHHQNNISVEFATSNYSPNIVQNYEYKLEGFDKEWHHLASNQITYTNISPGKYTLTVRVSEAINTQTNEKPCSLTIVVKPPFYKTTIAYISYLILVVCFLYGIIRIFVWRAEVKSNMEIEKREKEQNEKLNDLKLSFFSNISHELRTPLTLIIGQIETLMQLSDFDQKIQNKLSKVHKHALHMRNLISELLDLRKKEKGFYKLKIQEISIIEYLVEIYESFEEYALKENINFLFEHPNSKIICYIDPVQFKKVLYNLLSNAFKYTSSNGEIIIRVKQDKDIIIQVEDNGIGIPTELLNKIFERFYQVEYRSSGFSLGTGIGLALTKEIVESHYGNITAQSSLNKGSIFEIKLPTDSSLFSADEYDTSHKEVQKVDEELRCENNTKKDSILIVEDNEELLELLDDILSKDFYIHTATNGKIGFQMAQELQPDLIISDIMMPEMSGKDMCYQIKNSINISHIPVIMLTSLDSVDETIDGYIFGADDYITKPFNMEILKIRCKNLISNRKLLYSKIAKQENSALTTNILEEQDRLFIEEVTRIIKQNFENPDFDMNILATKLGLGRNKLYSKMKEITGLTPNEFTLKLKLSEATHLLENYIHLNISEIAIQLGFSSTKYFSKSFKTFYGVAPLQWRKDKLGDNK